MLSAALKQGIIYKVWVEEEQMSWNFFENNEIKIIVLLKTTDDLILLISIKLSTTYIMNIQVRSTKWTLYFVLIKCLTATYVILYLLFLCVLICLIYENYNNDFPEHKLHLPHIKKFISGMSLPITPNNNEKLFNTFFASE